METELLLKEKKLKEIKSNEEEMKNTEDIPDKRFLSFNILRYFVKLRFFLQISRSSIFEIPFVVYAGHNSKTKFRMSCNENSAHP